MSVVWLRGFVLDCPRVVCCAACCVQLKIKRGAGLKTQHMSHPRLILMLSCYKCFKVCTLLRTISYLLLIVLALPHTTEGEGVAARAGPTTH